MINTTTAYGRESIRGIARYSREHGPWSLTLDPIGVGMPTLGAETGVVDGLIARVADERMRARLHAIRSTAMAPCVDLSNEFSEMDIPRVVPDPEAVARAAVDHLLDRGFTEFGYCGVNGQAYSRKREQAFVAHLDALGHRCRAYTGRQGRQARTLDVELRRMADWLGGFDGPAGVLACNDWRAGQLLRASRIAGLHVPDTIGVVGIDNDAVACETGHVTLTSVEIDAERIGYEAARRLDAMMRGDAIDAGTVHAGDVYVEARASTDVLLVADPIVRDALQVMRRSGTPPRSVAEVVAGLALSRRPFEKRFRAAVGRSPNEELQQCRIRLAERLLRTTDLPISTIAERCGYGYAHQLSAAFGRLRQQTPSAYRELSRASGLK
ncbi:MAG: XylR family transcriptional regulator [Planctomycetota bacterium]